MATRNLTKAFSQARNGGKANRSILKSEGLQSQTSDSDQHSDSGLLHADGENIAWKAARDVLPPPWVDAQERAEECIEKIQLGIRELSSLHSKRLMVNFEANEEDQERQINFKTGDITELFRQTESLLKKIGKQGGGDESHSAGERTVRRNMQSQLAKKLQGLSMTFRTSQKAYMNKVQAQKSGSGNVAFEYLDGKGNGKSGAASASISVDFLSGGSSSGSGAANAFSASQMLVVNEMEETVNQRDAEIVAIAKSIEELAQIFKELAVLVIDQGTILDRIDYNMEMAVDHTKEGVLELEKAEEHQKNAQPIKCISFLVVGIIVCLIILINRWKRKSN